jgi:dGTPase
VSRTAVNKPPALLRTRLDLEAREAEHLSPLAVLSRDAVREHGPEVDPPPTTRTHFQRDWNRVMHSEAFRKLEYKTQVFPFGEGLDVTRTRLTHTLEVFQIAEGISQALGLNNDLVTAIALAHDLGHPPFGHAGEDVLRELAGFNHNAHGLRIARELEHRYPFPGLNLTTVVLEGMEKHDTDFDKIDQPELFSGQSPPLETQIASLADMIAYRTHDIEDALNSGILRKEDFRAAGLELWDQVEERVASYPEEIRTAQTTRCLIDLLITDVLGETVRRLEEHGIRTLADVRKHHRQLVDFSDDIKAKQDRVGRFLRAEFYSHYKIMRMTDKGKRVIRALIEEYMNNPGLLPPAVQARYDAPSTDPAWQKRVIADHLAGMTDRYAVLEHRRLFDPEVRV